MGSDQVSMCWHLSPLTGHQLLFHLQLAEAANEGGIGVGRIQYFATRARMIDGVGSSDDMSAIKTLKLMQEIGLLEILAKDDSFGFSYHLLWDSTKTDIKEAVLASESVGEDLDELHTEERMTTEQSQASHASKAYVYLLRCGEYFKIGRTNNLDRRMDQLSIQLPHKPQIIHAIHTNVPAYTERFFHEKFGEFRLNGEWFQLSQEAIGYFCSFLDISKDHHGVTGYHYLTRVAGLVTP
jgi:hypothetical protein